MDFPAVNSAALAALRPLVLQWIPGGAFRGNEYVVANPTRTDKTAGSFSINTVTGVWKDFASSDGGKDPVSLFAYLNGLKQGEACTRLAEQLQTTPAPIVAPAPTETWQPISPVPLNVAIPKQSADYIFEIRDKTGALLCAILRTDAKNGQKKIVRPLTYCQNAAGETAWRNQRPDRPYPVYGAELLRKKPSAKILLLEGELKAAKINDLDHPEYIGVSAIFGAEAIKHADFSALKGRDFVLWPDNDSTGRECMGKAVDILKPIARSIVTLKIPADKPEKWDAADLFRDGGDQFTLDAFLSDAVPKPTPVIRSFPTIESSLSYRDARPPIRPVLIDGILRQSHKMLIGAPSKAGKSFVALRLALSVAHGREWFGHQCTQGGVLILNLEVDTGSYWSRCERTASAFGLCPHHENLDFLHLRGVSMDIEDLLPLIGAQIEGKRYSMLIVDPLYKLLRSNVIRGISENDSAGMSYLLGEIDRMTEPHGCSPVYVSHFAKGFAGTKSQIDRVSGSGVLARDPDAICTFSEIEEAGCYRVEFSLREFAAPDPISVRWAYPLHEVDTMLDETPLKGSRVRATKTDGDRADQGTEDERVVLGIIAAHPGLSMAAIIDQAMGQGVPYHRARAALSRLEVAKRLTVTEGPRRAKFCCLRTESEE